MIQAKKIKKNLNQTIEKGDNFIQNAFKKMTQLSPKKVSIVFIILIAFFVFWIVKTIVPILVVEIKYQSQRVAEVILPNGSLKSLFVPNLSLDLDERSLNPEYGIKIPQLYLDEPVVFNVNPNDKKEYKQALKQGIAHASGSGFPGDVGIGYYFAHSSSPEFRSQYNAVFYLLGKLEKNDKIIIWHEGEKFVYSVTNKRVTKPEEVDFIKEKTKKEKIVLQTCWPPGTTLKRLLVFAEKIDEDN